MELKLNFGKAIVVYLKNDITFVLKHFLFNHAETGTKAKFKKSQCKVADFGTNTFKN